MTTDKPRITMTKESSIESRIKERTVSRDVALLALTALEKHNEIILFTKSDLDSLLEAYAKEQRDKAIADCKNAFCLGYHEKEDVWEWDEEALKRIDDHLKHLQEKTAIRNAPPAWRKS